VKTESGDREVQEVEIPEALRKYLNEHLKRLIKEGKSCNIDGMQLDCVYLLVRQFFNGTFEIGKIVEQKPQFQSAEVFNGCNNGQHFANNSIDLLRITNAGLVCYAFPLDDNSFAIFELKNLIIYMFLVLNPRGCPSRELDNSPATRSVTFNSANFPQVND
jgi:hypothetical protein